MSEKKMQQNDSQEQEYISRIGKIKLNLKHYPGEDLYCDGAIEDELLEIARDYSTVEFQRIIEEKKSWPVLYHLSALRENIVEWLPIDKKMKVLEIGAGCGAITGALAAKAGEVTCIDLSKKRSMINAYRHVDCDNVMIHVGNFQDVEPDLPCDYDYICLIGVFEYAQAYIQSETPYEDFLNIIKKHVKPQGHIVIAIENKFGLKYWAGCKEDHLGTYFSGLEDYPDGGVVRTFTKDGLLAIARKCGCEETSMYYPYPDYKFPTSIYSDAYLPKVGELSSNLRNFDRERLQLFDEKKVFDSIIRENQFPLFSNSYMLVLGPKLPIEYVKYSNDRADAFRIKTILKEDTAGKRIEKHPLSDAAQNHIRKTYEAYAKLDERYRGGELSINRCKLEQSGQEGAYLSLEYLTGTSLTELLDEKLESGDWKGFQALFEEYVRKISYREEEPVADYDLIFANILVSADNTWNVIDYEWTFNRPIETKEIAFRAVYCYLLENEKRNKLNLDLITEKLGITQVDMEQYRKQEMDFQKYVTGKCKSMAEIREDIGYPVYTVEAFIEGQLAAVKKDRVQIYEDTGKGFREERSFFLEENDEQVQRMADGSMELNVPVAGGRSALRIDPCSDYCIVSIKQLLWNGEAVAWKGKQVQTNGTKVGEQTYVFATKDPNITVSLLGRKNEQTNLLQVSLEVTRLPEETAKRMQKRGLF